MIDVFIYFSDIIKIGKVDDLIKATNAELNIIKIADKRQIAKYRNETDALLITDYENHQDLMGGVEDISFFNKIIVIDEVDQTNTDNILYLKTRSIETEIQSVLNDFLIQYYSDKEFASIPTKNIQEETFYGCDFYLKLSEKKHIKILNAKASFPEGTLQSYLLKGINHLHVRGCDFRKISEKSNIQVLQTRREFEEPNSIEALHTLILDIGFDEKVIQMTKVLHRDMEEKFSNRFMKKLFVRFKSLEGDYLYNHSFLTSVVALEVGRKFTWMTPESKEKIYLASVLHDLGHSKKENALKESSTLEKLNLLPSSDREDILNHPLKFANHLSQIESLHSDIIKMVKDHHGIHSENAYPRAISPNEINLIFALFVISHEFSVALYTADFDLNQINSILAELNQKFDKGNYKKILPEFNETILDVFFKEDAA